MPPVAIMGAIGAASSVAGGLIGSSAAAADREAAAAASQKALEQIQAMGAPPDLSRQIFMEQFRQAGILTPEMEKEINVQFEKAAPVSQKTVKAQEHALERLKDISEGGMSAEERVAQREISGKQARENIAARNQILQEMQQRGQAGGGAELAMRLQAQQGSANQAAMESDRVAANAQRRALEALTGLGNLSGQMRGQEFTESKTAADIANEQARFNVANQLAIQQRNIGAKNIAQEQNLRTAQDILNANVQMGNVERLRQAEAERQRWQDQLGLAKAKAGSFSDEASQRRSSAQETAARGAGIGAGIGSIFGAAGSAMGQQQMLDRMYPQIKEETDYSQFGIKSGIPTSGPRRTGATYWKGGEVYNEGGMVGGEAPIPGDHPANDIVDAELSPGEIIVPRSASRHPELAKAFIEGVFSNKRK